MEKAKILIVDDDPDLRNALQATLEGVQYVVITAADGKEGMEKIRNEKPSLVILDVMMETWDDGFEVARQLKKDTNLGDISILMLTGVKGKTGIDFKTTAGDKTWCPVDGFLDKPVDHDLLLAEVERLLKK
ncbi:MAG: response regulator [Planctomycetota bacterium]|jgi:CheY-like chemotaxis protein